MDNKQNDYKFITDLWHLLREYGDLKADGKDSDWHNYTDASEDIRQRFPEFRKVMIEIDEMMVRRARIYDTNGQPVIV